ncbi:MAG: metallophosphoesterase family protein [Desulfurivibrionaceae bacterium]
MFSDIHGNGAAFFAAYPKIIAERADLYLFLGDLCGYYYNQLAIYPYLAEIPNFVAICGNHEQMLLRMCEGEEELRSSYLAKFGHSMEGLLEQGNTSFCEWVAGWPLTYRDENESFSCFHGSPVNYTEGYLYPDTNLDDLRGCREKFVFLGHTHYCMDRKIGRTRFINPGSLGQPRDGAWPTYALVDTTRETVCFKKILYDRKMLLREIEVMGDGDKYLKRILGKYEKK